MVMQERRTPITPVQQMISSCSGAFITSVFVTPFDVVKIRLHAQDKPFRKGSAFIYHNGLMDHCVTVCSNCQANGVGNGGSALGKNGANGYACLRGHGPNCEVLLSEVPLQQRLAQQLAEEWYQHRPPVRLNGTVDAFAKIARMEGMSALWSGLPPTLVMAIPATVAYFTTYDILKYRLGYNENDPSTKHIPVLAGTAARTLATCLISPLELLRTKMQSEQLTYHELGKAMRLTLRECGMVALMRGLGPTLLRDVPFSAVYWFGYEYLKALQLRLAGSTTTSPTVSQSFVAGATAGAAAALLTNPFDVIKTRRQIELGKLHYCKDSQMMSTWRLMRTLLTEQGVKSLYVGLLPRLFRVTLSCSIMITSYEQSKLFFRTRNEQRQLAM